MWMGWVTPPPPTDGITRVYTLCLEKGGTLYYNWKWNSMNMNEPDFLTLLSIYLSICPEKLRNDQKLFQIDIKYEQDF